MTTKFKNRWMKALDLLSVIKSNLHGSEFEKKDLKGLPFGNKEIRTNLENLNFIFVDFSYADFTNCNFSNLTFTNCILSNVNFTELRQWNCIYNKCIIEKSDFTNSTFGVNSKFMNCTFQQAKLKGKYFDFGQNNYFEYCNFIKCEISSTWILSVVFSQCNFESIFKNVRFSGTKEAEISSNSKEKNYPVTFRNCNLEKSIFKDLEIMDGVILEETILPDQNFERFNDDRIFYPKH